MQRFQTSIVTVFCIHLSIFFYGCGSDPGSKVLSKTKYVDMDKNLIIDNLIFNIKYDDKIKLNKNLRLKDENGEEFLITSLFNKKEKKLFYYYSRNSCITCMDREMDKLRLLSKKYSNDIIILLAMDDTNQIKILKDKYKTGFRFLDIGNVTLSKKIDSLFVPYYFISDQDLNTSMVFIPDKNIDEPSKAYLKEVLGFADLK